MFAVTGTTGQVGGLVAEALLNAGKRVRAVVRNADKGTAWAKRGCEVVLADMNDALTLEAAFSGAEGVFVLIPPNFAPSKDFPEARAIIAAVHAALFAAQPAKIVCLSTIGAQSTRPNLLNQLGILERVLGNLPIPVAFLRAAWFIENAASDVAPAKENGIILSFLQPLDKKVPMIATADVGRIAAQLLQETWRERRIVEAEGPRRVAPNEIAAAFSSLLGRPVRMQAVPRERWEAIFKSQGTADPTPRIQMLDGFNEGWIEFEGGEAGSVKGKIGLETVLRGLIDRVA